MDISYKKKFYDKYIEIIPKLKSLETKRKSMLIMHRLFVLVFNFAYFALVFFIFFNLLMSVDLNKISFIDIIFNLFPYLFVFCFLYIFIHLGINCNKRYVKIFAQIVKNQCFDDLISVFDFIAPVPKDKRVEPSINQLYHRYSDKSGTVKPIIDDDFEGNYKEVKFRITEIFPLMMRGKLGVYSGPWGGIILKLKFNKLAKTRIFIFPQHEKGFIAMLLWGVFFCLIGGFTHPLFFVIAAIWTIIVVISVYYSERKRINLEDNSFHKKYYVEADDQIEARYILTTAFMERLKNLKTVFNSKNITCMIEGNEIIFAIETKRDLFEIGDVNIPAMDIRQFDRFYNEITSVCEMIDCLKLDKKTGL